MKQRVISLLGVGALFVVVSCGGGGGTKPPDLEPVGPSPDFSDSQSVESDLVQVSDALGQVLDGLEISLFEENSSSSGLSMLLAAQSNTISLPYDFATEVATLNGVVSGTASFSGIIDGELNEGTNSAVLDFQDVAITFANYSEEDSYIFDGTVEADGSMNVDSSGMMLDLTIGVALVVSGDLGATIEGSARIQMTLSDDDSSLGTIKGSFIVSAGDDSATCVIDVDLSQINADWDDSEAFDCSE